MINHIDVSLNVKENITFKDNQESVIVTQNYIDLLLVIFWIMSGLGIFVIHQLKRYSNDKES